MILSFAHPDEFIFASFEAMAHIFLSQEFSEIACPLISDRVPRIATMGIGYKLFINQFGSERTSPLPGNPKEITKEPRLARIRAQAGFHCNSQAMAKCALERRP
jgi:hypothetical protein